MPNMLLYILVAAGVTYAVRVLPLTLLRRPITSPFLQSFLYYVPYVTLSVMTFPAMVDATQSPIAGVAALAMGVFSPIAEPACPKWLRCAAARCCCWSWCCNIFHRAKAFIKRRNFPALLFFTFSSVIRPICKQNITLSAFLLAHMAV